MRVRSRSGRVIVASIVLLVAAAVLPLSPVPVGALPTQVTSGPPVPGIDPGPALYDEEVLADEPLVYHRLGDATTTATDSSGNGRHGTMAPSTTRGEEGAPVDDVNAAIANPSSGTWAVTAPDLALPSGGAPRTVELWAKPTGADRWLLQYGNRFGVYLLNGHVARVYVGPGGGDYYQFELPASIVDDTWHHVAATFDDTDDIGRISLFIDGQEVGAVTGANLNTATGAGLSYGQAPGAYDEVAVYAVALGPDRIANHWQRGGSRRVEACPGPPVEPVLPTDPPAEPMPDELDNPYSASVIADEPASYYRLGDTIADPDTRVALDVSGNCRHAAAASSATSAPSGVRQDDDGSLVSSGGAWGLSATARELPVGAAATTVEAWAKIDSSANDQWLFTYGDRTGLWFDHGSVLRAYVGPGGGSYYTVPLETNIHDNRWHQFALTFDGTHLAVYVDGAVVFGVDRSDLSTNNTTGGELLVGNAPGSYDEVAVYPAALTPARLADHWSLGQVRNGIACPAPPATPYSQSVLADSPASYYRLGEQSADGDTRVAHDSSGNCRHGARATEEHTGSGPILGEPDDGAMVTSGGAWGLSATARELPVGAAATTIEAWAKIDSSANDQWLFTYGDRTGLWFDHGSVLRAYVGPDGGSYYTVPLETNIHDNRWHQFALTFDGTHLAVYVDGAVVFGVDRSDLSTNNTTGGELLVGNAPGSYDEVAVYPAALTPARLADHWSLGQVRNGIACPAPPATPYSQSVLADSPASYYRLGEQSADGDTRVAHDSSGNCRHGARATEEHTGSGPILGEPDDGAMVTSGGAWGLSATARELPVGAAATTIEAWAKIDSSANDQWLFTYGDRTGLWFDHGTVLRAYVGPDGGSYYTVPLETNIHDNRWHQFALTFDGTHLAVYVDGAVVFGVDRSDLSTNNTTGGELLVGNAPGSYDEVAVYPAALTPARLADHWSLAMSSVPTSCAAASTSGHAQAVIDDDPLLFWRLGDLATDPAGRVAYDSSGNCRNGAYATASADAGALLGDGDGSAQRGDGPWLATGSAVDLPVGAEPFTIETWAKIAPTANDQWLFTYGDRAGLWFDHGTVLRAYVGPGGSDYHHVPLTTNIHDGGWHHFALSYDGTNLHVYVDGAEVRDVASSINTNRSSGGELLVGNAPGSYDELAVYDHALSDARIDERHADGSRFDTSSVVAGPAGDWHQGEELDFTVTVTPGPGSTGTPSGTVTVWDDNTLLGTDDLDAGGVASVSAPLTAGNHRIHARYAGDSAFVASSTPDVVRIVTIANPTVTEILSVSPSPAVFGQEVEVEARVETTAPTPPLPTGDIEILVDGVVAGSGTIDASGEVTVALSGLAPGTRSVTARYVGDINMVSSSSDPVALTVAAGASTTAVTGPTGPLPFSTRATYTVEVAASAPAAGVPTGRVELFVDGVEVADRLLSNGQVSVVLDDLGLGSHDITATYLGTPQFATSSTTAPVTTSIVAAATATSLSSDRNPATEGVDVTFTAQVAPVSPATAVPTGSVRFRVDGVEAATVGLSPTGTASFSRDDLVRGTRAVTAELLPDAAWTASSGQVSQLMRAPVTLTTSGGPSTVWGQAAPFTVRVAGDTELVNPSGTVQLRGPGGQVLAQAPLDAAGEATLSTAALPVGTTSVTIGYLGDLFYGDDTSSAVSHTVEKAGSHVAVQTSPNPSGENREVTMSARVTTLLPGTGATTGSVEFFLDGATTPFATGTIGAAGNAISTHTFDAVGDHTITASYAGDGNHTAATSPTHTHAVRPPTETTLSSGQNPAPFGATVTLTATVTATGGTPSGTVTFTEGSTTLGTVALDASGEAELDLDSLENGTHDIVANFVGTVWGPSSSATLQQTIGEAATTVTVTADPTSSVYGQSVAFEATVGHTVPGRDAEGQITFDLGDDEVVATLDAGVARIAVDDLDVGPHSIVASYGGSDDGNFGPSTSSPLVHTVALAPVAVTVATSADPIAPSTSVTYTATIAAAPPGAGEPSGTITFVADGTETLGSDTIDDGVATLTTSALDDLGTHSIVAQYGGDTRFATGASAPLDQHVNRAVSIAVTPPAASTALGAPAAFGVVVTPGTGTGVPTGMVALFEGDVAKAVATLDAGGAATLSTTALVAGSRTLHVRYAGDATFAQGRSTDASHTVTKGTTSALITASPSPAVANQPVTLRVLLQPSGPSAARPTGDVTVAIGTNPSQDLTLASDGTASLPLGNLAAGSYPVTASYDGDGNYTGSTAPAFTLVVEPPIDATFTTTREIVAGGLEVTVDGTTSTSGVTYRWDFGDGTTATSAIAAHTYTTPGIYVITLTVSTATQFDYATERIVLAEDVPAEAIAGDDQTVVEDEETTFDGRASRPKFGIDSWLWEFGDGTTSTDPFARHTFVEPGTYTVRLTVTRQGESNTDALDVEVLPAHPDQGLFVTVEDTNGARIVGADVVVIDQIDGRHPAISDDQGEATLHGLSNHTYSVYAVADGYRPAVVEATIIEGFGEATVVLEPGEVAVAELESRELTLPEIQALGISTTDPDNQHVYTFEIWLAFFDNPPIRYSGHVNSAGAFVASPSCVENECVWPVGGGAVSTRAHVTPDGKPTLIWLVIPGEARWLKQFFQVDMIVHNLATPDFAFVDGTATLDIPGGLSLAAMGEEQQAMVEMDDIVGGAAGTASWILRGDSAGSYDLSASYSASLYPIGTSVNLTAETTEPLVVNGADSLQLLVDADDEGGRFEPYEVTVSLTNVSDSPAYNATLEFFEAGTVGHVYQPRQDKLHIDAALAPGEAIVADLVLVPNAFTQAELNLEESFVKWVGGDTDLPDTIIEHEPDPPVGERPKMCAGGGEIDEDGQCSFPDSGPKNPLGAVALTWDATGGPYRVFRSTSPNDHFSWEPIAETGGTSYTHFTRPGEAGFYAVSNATDEHGVMLHNAVYEVAGTKTSAELSLSVQCATVGDAPQLVLDYADRYYNVNAFQVVNFDEEGNAIPIGGGTLSGQEGTYPWTIPEEVFAGATPIPGMKDENGDDIRAVTFAVQIKNDFDNVWTDPLQIAVFDTCSDVFIDDAAIPAAQTLGRGCQAEEYWARANLKGANRSRCAADPVNTATGNLVVAAGDVALASVAPAFDMNRTYNSLDDRTGPLGRGWTHPYNISLDVGEEELTLRGGDGQQVVFTFDPDYSPDGADYFRARGSYGQIKQTPAPAECDCTYIFQQRDYVTYEFDADGRLVEIRDRNGNDLEFTNDPATGYPTSVTDTADRTVTMSYNGGHLTGVSLPDGRSVGYGYTGDLLTSVTDVRGGTTTYRYEDDLLVEETDARGNRVHLTEFDPVSKRVVRQEDAAAAVSTWSWDEATGTSTMVDSVGATWIDRYEGNVLLSRTDPLGRTTSFEYDARWNVLAVVDPAGGRSTMSYDEAGNMVARRGPAPLSLTETFSYDDMNNRTRWTDAAGHTIEYDYDTIGRLTAVHGPQPGSTSTITNDPQGLVTETVDAEGNPTSMDYDAAGNLTQQCSALEHCTTYEYDASGRVIGIVGPLGHATGNLAAHRVSFTYDAADNRLSETDPRGVTSTYTYDANGNVIGSTAPGQSTTTTYNASNEVVAKAVNGNPATTFAYDSRGKLIATTTPGGRTTSYGIDEAGRLVSTTDPRGLTWRYEYDARGNKTAAIDPAGGRHRTEYDAAGRAIREINAAGEATSYTLDGNGNVLAVTDAANRTAQATYDASGNPLTVRDPLGRTTTHEYDRTGNLTRTTSPAGGVTTVTYDPDNRPTSVTEPRGNAGGPAADYTVTTVFDAAGNATNVFDPLDGETVNTYDAVGNLLTTRDPNLRTTSYDYDSASRVTEVTAPDGAVTAYGYDADGDLTTRTDPRGKVTTYTYDADHLLTSLVSPIGQQWTYGYDGNGNQVSVVDANAHAAGNPAIGTTTMTYDSRDLLTSVDYSDPATADITYTHDAVGRRRSMRDGAGLQTYDYDAVGQLTSTRRGAETFAYTYDGGGQLTNRAYPDGTAVGLDHDADGRLRSLSAFGGTTRYTYDPAGRPLTTQHANGIVETYTWDRNGRAATTSADRGATNLANETRTYDPAGNPLTETTGHGETDYGYDDQYRVTSACFGGSCPAEPSVEFEYDASGNRLAENRPSQLPEAMTYDDADRTATRDDGAGAVGLVHDANGNVLFDGQQAYTYNQAGKLIEVRRDEDTGGGTIRGQVTSGANPAGGVVVRAYEGGREVAAEVVAGDGSYELTGLDGGDHRLFFDDLARGTYRSEWYDDQIVAASSATITVAVGATVVADADLAGQGPTGAVGGVVTDAEGQPIAGAAVSVATGRHQFHRDDLTVIDHPAASQPDVSGLRVWSVVNGESLAMFRPPVPVDEGDAITYEYVVENPGTSSFTDVAVAHGGLPVTCPTDDGDNVIDEIAPGQTVTCTASTTASATATPNWLVVNPAGPYWTFAGAHYQVIPACTITGTSGNDVLTGTAGADVICGLGGNDTLSGAGGNDVVRGGPGDDWLNGGDGDDLALGEDDADQLRGDAGNDQLWGGNGLDGILGGTGNDYLLSGPGVTWSGGEAGIDIIYGGPEADVLSGGPDTDLIASGGGAGGYTVGDDGDDGIVGGTGTELLHGGNGADQLFGFGGSEGGDNLVAGEGNDRVIGSDGNDTIDGGGGNDVLDGAFGSDSFTSPQPGDTVMQGERFEGVVFTDASGAWSMDAPLGRYQVMFSADGYVGEAHPNTTDAAAVLDVDLTATGLTLDASLEPDGSPVPLAEPEPDPDPQRVVASFTYDGDGNRLTKTTDAGTTRYQWDSNAGYPQLAAETRPGGEHRTYVHGLDLVSVHTGGRSAFFHHDALGSVTSVTDAEGDLQWSYAYEPFGQTRVAQQHDPAALDNDFLYTGEQRDPETGLYYLRARYYDPSLGRFTQTDPVAPSLTDPFVSAYVYANNRVMTHTDPVGLRAAAAERYRQMAEAQANSTWTILGYDIDIDMVQEIAGFAGMIPVIGAPIDFVNGLVYLYRGKTADALLSFAGIIPIAGDGAQVARSAFRYSDELADAGRVLARGGDELAEVGQQAMRHVDDFASPSAIRSFDEIGESVSVLSSKGDNVAGAARRTEGASSAAKAGDSCPVPNSFDGNTLVLLADGSRKPIEDVITGDVVLATDPETGTTEAREVIDTIVGEGDKDLVDVTVETDAGFGSLIATDGHPFWVQNENDWIEAEDLDVGDLLLAPDGDLVRIIGLREYRQHETVHNLTVEGLHTYYVYAGGEDLLVHNCIRTNAANGELGERLGHAEVRGLGDTSKGQQVTFKFDPTGNGDYIRFRADEISANGRSTFINEYKASQTAPLTANQQAAITHLQNGGHLIPVGANARKAGLPVGQPWTPTAFREFRYWIS